MVLFFMSIVLGFYWLTQVTGLFDLIDVGYAGLVMVTTHNLEK